MTTPHLSVVVPTYNSASFVEATLDSVLAQTFVDYELVIADHASTDDTWERLQPYAADPRVRLMRTDAGGGAPSNWNRVTKAAVGELVKLVCADDLLYPTLLAEQVGALAAEPSAVMVACRRDLVDARGEVFLRDRGLARLVGLVPGDEAVRATVRAGTNIFGEPVCVTLRRSVLVDAGGWDGSFPYLIDGATYAAVLARGDLVAQRRTLAAFRVSAQQWSVDLVRQQARQAAGFHRSVAARGAATSGDVRLGNARALALASLRRLAYLRLGSRMQTGARMQTGVR